MFGKEGIFGSTTPFEKLDGPFRPWTTPPLSHAATANDAAPDDSGFPAVFALRSIDGTNGFRIDGEAAGDEATSNSPLGDVNGDGFLDLAIGATYASPNGAHSGAGYVVFGGANNLAALDTADGHANGRIALTSLDGDNGFKLNGEAAYDYAGVSMSATGDVNGDGIGDVMIGASQFSDPDAAGAAYLVFGKTSGFAAVTELSSIAGVSGYKFVGDAFPHGRIGSWVGTAGDLNGDGTPDLMIAARGDSSNGAQSGAAYVVFGTAGNLATLDAADGATDGQINVTLVDGSTGFKLTGGAAGDSVGRQIATAGDINRDGYADIVVSGHQVDSNGEDSGAAYVVFGKASGFDANIDLASLDGHNGFQVSGQHAGDFAGYVNGGGDINGDGFADLIVGVPLAYGDGPYAGAAYVVYGHKHGFDANFQLSAIDGTNGFRIDGAGGYAQLGDSVASGDVNGDGFDDVTVGAAGTNGYAGTSYVIYGKASGFGADVDVTTLDGDNGFALVGTHHYDLSGYSTNAADLNGDGFADIIIGANYFRHYDKTGATYVVYGVAPDESVNRSGTVASQTLAGGDFDDTLFGRGGDDRLFGNGGADRLWGERGDDSFVYTDASDSTGPAFDTIKHADFNDDAFDVPSAVTGIDATIASGYLGRSHFDGNLAAAADGTHLAAGHAVLFTPDRGHYAGANFLVVDLNGVAGYQASEDLVVRLAHAMHLGQLDADSFI